MSVVCHFSKDMQFYTQNPLSTVACAIQKLKTSMKISPQGNKEFCNVFISIYFVLAQD